MEVRAFILFVLGLGFCSGQAIIDPELKARFFGGGGGGNEQSVIVSFTQSISTVFSQIDRMNFSSQLEQRNVLTEMQEAFTKAAQAPLQTFLSSQGVSFESFWINNQMNIPKANSFLVSAISMIPGVAKIEPEPTGQFDHPFIEKSDDFTNVSSTRQSNVQWGIERIRADRVWRNYDGEGVVVANIDTGVRYTHEALKARWRRSYGWYDPYDGTTYPYDDDGHGTHTMGTITGSNGIGVAPAATWIACKGGGSSGWVGSNIIKCAQWIQCPTRPDGTGKNCQMAPAVVSNSWSRGGGDNYYKDVVDSWRRAGIIPVFSSGNTGPDCGTVRSPGDYANVINVGSTDSEASLARSSSRGPTKDGRTKPDISAPGVRIQSAWSTGDSSYKTISGTSMATPHVAGTIALMKEKTPGATYDQIYRAITRTAERNSLNTGSAQSCGGVSSRSYPNNGFGHGEIDALDSVGAI